MPLAFSRSTRVTEAVVTPSYGWYGDDFTGATDTLATLVRRGRRAFLFLRVPDRQRLAQAGDLEAVGIAGAARAMEPDEMRAELAPVGAFFRDVGVRILHYKCCSTFDSAPARGNIAIASAILREYVTHETVAIVGGQPSLGRYCAFSNLFASLGADGGVFRLDRHPTMSRHPATPMNEADLRKHLAALGMQDVGAIHWPLLACDPEVVAAEWQRLSKSVPAVLLDALDAQHVEAIGRLLKTESQRRSLLAVGPSSVAQAFFEEGTPMLNPPQIPVDGPVLAFVGSLSPTTRGQMAAARSYTQLAVDPDSILSSPMRANGSSNMPRPRWRRAIMSCSRRPLRRAMLRILRLRILQGLAPPSSMRFSGVIRSGGWLLPAATPQAGLSAISAIGDLAIIARSVTGSP
jgi:uncharacterized protein YgbK (DUF1537 family)